MDDQQYVFYYGRERFLLDLRTGELLMWTKEGWQNVALDPPACTVVDEGTMGVTIGFLIHAVQEALRNERKQK